MNATLAEHFDERQIYRIDHYLGKETVQNLMAIRFGNVLFEPLWKAQYVDHIQITVAETVGSKGGGPIMTSRGACAIWCRTTLMQLLCLTAMEPPSRFDPDAVRDEKLKVIRALEPLDPRHVRGQYQGSGDGKSSYREDVEDPRSITESFMRMKVICPTGGGRHAVLLCAPASG